MPHPHVTYHLAPEIVGDGHIPFRIGGTMHSEGPMASSPTHMASNFLDPSATGILDIAGSCVPRNWGPSGPIDTVFGGPPIAKCTLVDPSWSPCSVHI